MLLLAFTSAGFLAVILLDDCLDDIMHKVADEISDSFPDALFGNL